jgi:hypothetical protein
MAMKRLLLLLALGLPGCSQFADDAEELTYLSEQSNLTPQRWTGKQTLLKDSDTVRKWKTRMELKALQEEGERLSRPPRR